MTQQKVWKQFPQKSEQEEQEELETCTNLKGPPYGRGLNIPILSMAFLTFAEAKVVAPPILAMNKLVT